MGELTLIKRNGESIPLFSKSPFCTVKSAQQSQTLMGDDTVTLNIISTEVMEFAKGDKIIVGGEEYTIRTPVGREQISDRHFSYDVVFYGVMYELMKSLYRNAWLDGSGNVKSDKSVFDLTYTLSDFVKVIIYNLNRDYPGLWAFDENNCPETEAMTISFSRQNCLQVLQMLCSKEQFDYDFKITQNNGVRTIHIGHFGQSVVPPGGGEYFEWGNGNGLYKLKEEKVDDKGIKTRLWVEGGSQNIRSNYRDYAGALQLPYPRRMNTKAHTLRDGTVIQANSEMIGISDDSKRYFEDATLAAAIGSDEDAVVYDDIYPKRTGEVTALAHKKDRYNQDTQELDPYAFIDSTMNFDLNEKVGGNTVYLIEGVSAKITFIDGRLAGQQFEVELYDTSGKRFKLIPFTDNRGLTVPMSGENDPYRIEVGNHYKLTDIQFPAGSVYEQDAEEELWYEGLQDFNDIKQAKVKYTLTFDRLYFLETTPRDSQSVLFNVGDYVPVKDERFNVQKTIRITQIQRNLLVEQDYSLTLSDTHTVSVSTQAVITVMEHEKIVTTYGMKDLTRAKRGWRTTEELRNMIYDTDGYFDTDNIKALSIDTNMLSVGSKSQQFVLTGAILEANYNGNANTFHATRSLLSHLTIEKDSVRNWEVAEATIPLEYTDGYYLFAKCPKTGNGDGTWYMTRERIVVEPDDDPNNYYFQVGILSSVYNDGFRDFVTTYGFTRINGNTITTGKIVTADGGSYLDLDNNQFKMGDNNSSIDYNVTANNQITLKNVKLLSTSGDTSDLGVYRGNYASNIVYYRGDEVSYTVDGETCTYRYKNPNPSSGKVPTNSTYWDVVAKGAKGDTGNSFFYTFNDSQTRPNTPTGSGNTDGWHTNSTDAVIWMSVKSAKDISSGSWGTPIRVRGADGTSISLKGTVSNVSQLPTTGNVTGDAYIIGQNLYVWDGTNWQNVGQFKGNDGTSSYLHMKYSDDGGETFTAGQGETPGRWVGMYVDQNPIDSDTPSDYAWRDGRGEQGIPGEPGEDGRTPYLHIKYSDDGGLSFTGHNGEDSGAWIGVYTDFEVMDSADPSKYTWTRVTTTGAAGADSEVGNYYEYRYQKNGSTSQAPELDESDPDPEGWSKEMPSIEALEYIWCTMCVKSALKERTVFHIPVKNRYGALDDDSGNGYNGYGNGEFVEESYPGGETINCWKMSGTQETTIPCDLPFGDSFTLSLWMKFTKSGVKWILTSENGREYVENDIDVGTGSWHHFAFRFNDTTCSLFIDGELKHVAVVNSPIAGFSVYDDNLFGSTVLIDDVRLLHGALAQADINRVKNGEADLLIQAWCTPFRVNPVDATDPVSVDDVDVEYAKGTSNTTAPTSGWQTTAPTWEDGKYIWSRTKVTYTDGSEPYYSNPVCVTGGKGSNGNNGRGIKEIVEQYYLSSSKDTCTGGSWSGTYPGWMDGWYIWTRSIVKYTIDGTTVSETVTSTPICVTGGRGQTGPDGKSAKYIYLKGTGRNREANSEVEIFNGTTSNSITQISRGLRLVTVNRDTLAVVDNIVYDVYSSNAAYGDTTERTALANKLNSLNDSVFVCIVSYDAVGWSEAIVNALKACGSWGVDNVTTGRRPFAFIGMKGLAQGNAIQIQCTDAENAPYAEISTYVAREMFATSNAGDMKVGPASPFRGVYDSQKTYYGTPQRVDIVKYNGVYYVARVDAGAFNNVTPTNTTKWNTFGAQFDSVATELLLAENANIAGMLFHNNRLESQKKDANNNPMIIIDGVNGNGQYAGIVKANLFYGATKKVTTTPYTINPATEPYNFFFYDNPKTTMHIILPSATTYEGLEISIFIKEERLDDGYGVDYAFTVRPPVGEYLFYIPNIGHANVRVWSGIATPNPTWSYKDLSYISAEVTMTKFLEDGQRAKSIQPNNLMKVKAINGAWYIVQGNITEW